MHWNDIIFYRDHYGSPDKGDVYESTKTTSYIMVDNIESGEINYHNDMLELNGKEVNLTFCETSMLFCLFLLDRMRL